MSRPRSKRSSAQASSRRAKRAVGSGLAARVLFDVARADPGEPLHPETLDAAVKAAAAVLAELRADPSLLPRSKELENVLGASEAQLRKVLLRNVGVLRGVQRQASKPRRPPKKPPPGGPGPVPALPLPTGPPDAPTNVAATAGNASALVSWTAPTQPATTYTVTPFVGTTARPAVTVDGLTPFALVTGLVNGTTYTFNVKATNAFGTSADSLPSNPVTPSAPGTAPFEPTLPPLTSEPVLQLDPAAETARQLLSEAMRIGAKWRFEYLKRQAIEAAQEALAYEAHVTTLMQMTLTKASSAEVILNATLLDAAARIQTIARDLAALGSVPEVDQLVGPLADAASDALLLPRFLLWLARTSPIGFWIGMFEAMISDLASVFLSDTDFSRTHRFLRHAFESDVDGVKAGVQQAVQDVLLRLDDEVDAMIAPLKAAIVQVVGGTTRAMAEVFEAYDLPLLMNPPAPPSTLDVPNVDPIGVTAQELLSEVETQADAIKQQIRARLEPLLAGTADKFVVLAATYLVIPIVAFLAISLAGGPLSAALLAAAVLIAAEELIHLLLSWLTGPLLKKVDEVRRRADELIGRLNALFATHAEMARNFSPELILTILANEVRELRDLLPDEFVRQAAALLQAARDVVLRDGIELALGAEQSLGMENGTAFEVIRDAYVSSLPQATQLPAGTDPSLFASAVLLRDLGRLDQQRTSLRDPKETEFTVRLSLFRLLGGDPASPIATPGEFSRFLSTREAVVRLTEAGLIDERSPGVYRALIKEVRLSGIFNTTPAGSVTGGIPVSVTHLGESRTRIKRSANPNAPPLQLPECVHLSEEEFGVQAADQAALEQAVLDAFATVPLAPRWVYFIVILVGLGYQIPLPFRQAAIQVVPGAVADRIVATLDVCGFVDPGSCRERAAQMLRSMPWPDMGGALLAGATSANLEQPPPLSNLAPVATQVAQTLRTGMEGSTDLTPGLEDVAREAYRAAVEAFQHRIAKWGGAYLQEDPDPQVRSLGFATLVRPQAPETAVFSLFPDLPTTGVRAEAPASTSDGPPFAAAPTLQYRPFENRGIDGRLLVRLEPGADGATQLSDQLNDVVLEVVVRALYDQDLAATVRAGNQQRRNLLGLAGQLSTPPLTIVVPGTRPEVQAATGDVRTIDFSLRAQRDRTIDAWTTALQINPALVPTINGLGALARLGPGDPYAPLRPLGSAPLDLTVSFDDGPSPTANEAALLALERLIQIGPADLGFPTNVLTAIPQVVEDSRLLSVGIAVIPTPAGVRAPGTLDTEPEPIGLTIAAPSPLDVLVPGFATATPLGRRLAITPLPAPPAAAPSVRLVDVWNAATAPTITASIPAAAFGTTPLLYDIVFSLTFTVPTLAAPTALAAVR
jgi:hypothetical protein